MALSAAELAAQIQQTEAFISADETTISISRTAQQRLPGGGRGPAAEPVASSLGVRMIPARDRAEKATLQTVVSLGTEVREWTLLAMPGSDVQVDDTFFFDGETCKVITVTSIEYELKAEVRTVG